MKAENMPEAISSAAEVEAAIKWCEQAQVALSSRIRIYTDTFNIPHRFMKVLRSGQVTQDEAGICDSPFIEKLRTRCDDHISAQAEAFSTTYHFAQVSLSAAKTLLAESQQKLTEARSQAEGDIRVDKSNVAHMDESDAAQVEAHDRAKQRQRLSAQAAEAARKQDDLQALVIRAGHVVELLQRSCLDHCQHVQAHFREQALDHLAWAHRHSKLRAPYKLPGSLETLPPNPLSLSKEGIKGDA